jgi:hypothetical protein
MTVPWRYVLPVAAAVAVVVACSGTPTKPSVSFTAPLGAGPATGANFKYTDQPITLTITNATRTGPATVTYNVSVSTDPAFSNVAFSKAGVAEDPSGKTSVQVTVLTGGKTYYWHWEAVVDGVTGQPSAAESFYVGPPITINPPIQGDPAGGSTQYGPRPTFTVTNATYTGTLAGPLYYEFQVSTAATFATLLASGTVQETPDTTSWTPSVDLPVGPLFWRARATDPADATDSNFTNAVAFTLAAGIDLSQVVYVLGPNISTWPQTSTITSATADEHALCIYHTKLGVWPTTAYFGDPSTQIEGNQWVFAYINGKWYGGAADWYRPGQACKDVTRDSIGQDAFYLPNQEPLHSWIPAIGEVFAVASTTPARAWPDMATIDERTNVVFVHFSN